MSKIIKKSNYRVVVEPKTHIYGIALSEDAVKGDCREIVDQIKRHVDDVCRVDIEFDTEAVCSHCGYGWELDEETGAPVCCNKAVDEFNNEKLKA